MATNSPETKPADVDGGRSGGKVPAQGGDRADARRGRERGIDGGGRDPVDRRSPGVISVGPGMKILVVASLLISLYLVLLVHELGHVLGGGSLVSGSCC